MNKELTSMMPNDETGDDMTTELQRTIEFTDSQVELIKRTIARGATDDELNLFIAQCKRTGLDPFSRQIHAVKRWDSSLRREVLSIQTGIDGFRLIAERTGVYAGNDDPVYDVENAKHPNKATATVWKIVNGQRVAFTRSARWSEFVQTKKDGEVTRFWDKMPYLMLGKVAEALALRAAFPQELSGLYTTDEMGQSDHAPEQEPVKEKPALPPKQANGTPQTFSADFLKRVIDVENQLMRDGKCNDSELRYAIEEQISKAGLPDDLKEWDATQRKLGGEIAKRVIAEFQARDGQDELGEHLAGEEVAV